MTYPTGFEGLGLLAGHLLGDYVLQTDWMATNKINPFHGWERPYSRVDYLTDGGGYSYTTPGTEADRDEYDAKRRKWYTGHIACTAHCLLYTLAVWACSFWWMPWWGLVVCFVAHWPVDRFRLAGWWMRSVSRQKAFAGAFSPPNLPWGVVAVDNTFHVLTLFLIALVWSVCR